MKMVLRNVENLLQIALRHLGCAAHCARRNSNVQRSAKRLVRGCEKFVPALAYLFCLALPGFCLARFTNLFADLCTGLG